MDIMLLKQTCILIGLTTFTLIQMTNTLVVLSLNIEDIQRLKRIGSSHADLFMEALRQDNKIRVKESNKDKNIPRKKEYHGHATQRALRTYTIPKLGEHGRSYLNIVFERPSKKLKPIFRARDGMTTPIASIPGDVFDKYAGKTYRREKTNVKLDKDYHGEPPIMQTAEPTPGLPEFGRQTFVNAAQPPDAIHIRQIGNRVISSIASSGRRNGGDLVMRPMIADDQYGGPPRPGELIKRRALLRIHNDVVDSKPNPMKEDNNAPSNPKSMFNIQKNDLESIPDPEITEQSEAQTPRRSMHRIQNSVLQSIPDLEDQRPTASGRRLMHSKISKPDNILESISDPMTADESEPPPISRRSMYSIQHVVDSKPDSRSAEEDHFRAPTPSGPRRAMYSIQDNVMEIIADPNKYK